jgi:hypothetical protein
MLWDVVEDVRAERGILYATVNYLLGFSAQIIVFKKLDFRRHVCNKGETNGGETRRCGCDCGITSISEART